MREHGVTSRRRRWQPPPRGLKVGVGRGWGNVVGSGEEGERGEFLKEKSVSDECVQRGRG